MPRAVQLCQARVVIAVVIENEQLEARRASGIELGACFRRHAAPRKIADDFRVTICRLSGRSDRALSVDATFERSHLVVERAQEAKAEQPIDVPA